jgi:hypothetical protein
MKRMELLERQLGPAARLISAADREWLVKEMSAIEAVDRKLREIDKGATDFAAMSALPTGRALRR